MVGPFWYLTSHGTMARLSSGAHKLVVVWVVSEESHLQGHGDPGDFQTLSGTIEGV